MQTQLARLGAESAPLSLIAAMSAKPTPSLSPPPPAAPVVVQARLARGSSSGKLQQPLPQQPLPQQQPQVGIFSAGAMASADAVSAPPHQHQHQQQRRQPQHVPHMAPSPSPSPSPRAMAPPLPAALLAVLAPVPSLPGFVPMEGMGGAPLTMAPGPAAGHAWPAAAGVSAMVMASPRSLATAPSSAAVAAFEEEAEAAAEQAAVDETEVQVSRGRRADSWQVSRSRSPQVKVWTRTRAYVCHTGRRARLQGCCSGNGPGPPRYGLSMWPAWHARHVRNQQARRQHCCCCLAKANGPTEPCGRAWRHLAVFDPCPCLVPFLSHMRPACLPGHACHVEGT